MEIDSTDNLIAYRFVSQTIPPDDPSAPAYWFLFQGDRLLVIADGEEVTVPRVDDPAALGLQPIRRQYLGYLSDGEGERLHCFSAEIADDVPLPPPLSAEGLRALYGRMDETLFRLAGRAVQIVDWDRTHLYCSRCATPVETMLHDRSKKCPKCGLSSYPRLSPAIIIAVVRSTPEGNRLLMARNQRSPVGRFSVIAGFVEPGESLEDCARREVREETGIRIRNIRYFASQSWPFPNSLMIGFTAEYESGDIVPEESEIAEAGWFAADALPQLPPRMSISRRLIDWFAAQNGVYET
jgi:NAD+ diphosphatase